MHESERNCHRNYIHHTQKYLVVCVPLFMSGFLRQNLPKATAKEIPFLPFLMKYKTGKDDNSDICLISGVLTWRRPCCIRYHENVHQLRFEPWERTRCDARMPEKEVEYLIIVVLICTVNFFYYYYSACQYHYVLYKLNNIQKEVS